MIGSVLMDTANKCESASSRLVKVTPSIFSPLSPWPSQDVGAGKCEQSMSAFKLYYFCFFIRSRGNRVQLLPLPAGGKGRENVWTWNRWKGQTQN